MVIGNLPGSRAARRIGLSIGIVLSGLACGERDAPPPRAEPMIVPAPPESTTAVPDTLVGDSVMVRDTLWAPGR